MDRFNWDMREDSEVSQCVRCRHKHAGAAGCRAFPREIPPDILINVHDHREPFPGDGGIRFQPGPPTQAP